MKGWASWFKALRLRWGQRIKKKILTRSSIFLMIDDCFFVFFDIGTFRLNLILCFVRLDTASTITL
ncbi:uncharacterized protein DS421_5g160290 [Arachis hypogaea]|nr:uncharacterized protein DS421_5g160290 [Arachis hypogaea]